MGKQLFLKKNREFLQVYQQGKSKADRYLVLYVLRRENEDGVRFGLTVGRKLGKAVRRNRVKRRLREICRHLRPSLLPGYWLVIVARPAAAEADYHTLAASLRKLLQKNGLLAEEGSRK
ncbi:MAG: ribonuclease protein component [Eubacteriales bacterium]|nr:ribonuclease protein component [Eubacteriales bacterium]